MLLKISTKCTPGGRPLDTGLQWRDFLYEGDEIFVNQDGGFAYMVKKAGEVVAQGHFNMEQFGYTLFNAEGNVVSRHFTPISDEQLERLRLKDKVANDYVDAEVERLKAEGNTFVLERDVSDTERKLRFPGNGRFA